MPSSPPEPLPAARSVRGRGDWHGAARDVVVLDFDARHRRRLAMRGVHGTAFLLDLAEATALRGGDALVLDDGALVEVVAAPESLVEVSADPAVMVRLAWHLGNRHLPVQLAGKRLRLRRDHVIEAMIASLGGRLVQIEAPFDPEGGAYAAHGHASDGHASDGHARDGHAKDGHASDGHGHDHAHD